MSPSELDALLTVLAKHNVHVYADGSLQIQRFPDLPKFGEPEIDEKNVPGGWKRGPDLDAPNEE